MNSKKGPLAGNYLNLPTRVAVDSSGNSYVINGPGAVRMDSAASRSIRRAATAMLLQSPPSATIPVALQHGACDTVWHQLYSGGNIYVANAAEGIDGMGSVTEYAALGSNTGVLNVAPIAANRR
jgi:hypothetical protein